VELYGYCGEDPTNWVDPDCTFPSWAKIWGGILTAVGIGTGIKDKYVDPWKNPFDNFRNTWNIAHDEVSAYNNGSQYGQNWANSYSNVGSGEGNNDSDLNNAQRASNGVGSAAGKGAGWGYKVLPDIGKDMAGPCGLLFH
jgi:hypothetical protein